MHKETFFQEGPVLNNNTFARRATFAGVEIFFISFSLSILVINITP